jgi:hypothetical protein
MALHRVDKNSTFNETPKREVSLTPIGRLKFYQKENESQHTKCNTAKKNRLNSF